MKVRYKPTNFFGSGLDHWIWYSSIKKEADVNDTDV